MSTAKFNTWQNPDGTENYKCRAWVNFNGTGTVAIRASGNVSSIVDNGTGQYTVNFTTAMPDENYAFQATARDNSGGDGSGVHTSAFALTASNISINQYGFSGGYIDVPFVSVTIFR